VVQRWRLKNKIIDKNEGFDYIDNPWSSSQFLQIGDFGVTTVLNDSRACSHLMKNHFEKINSSLSKLQFLEIFSHLCFLSFHLNDRPTFHSRINKEEGYIISANLPIEVTLVDEEKFITGIEDYLYKFTAKTIGNISERDSILENIKKKNWTFLWNEKGEFNSLE
jgi:hypothetical protein